MRKPVLFTAFVAVFFCLIATACGKKESSDVRPELTETRNTLKSLQEQQSELERKVTALEQLIEKNNQEVARLNAEIQRTADNAKRQALEQSKRTLLSELQTLEINKQGLERTLEELKARISGIEERLARLENQVSSDKGKPYVDLSLSGLIGRWHWDLKADEYTLDYVTNQEDRAVSPFLFKKYATKVIKTGSTSPSSHMGSDFTPIGVKLLEINIQPGGKGYARFKNTNRHLAIGQGETFQKDFTYEYKGNGFIVINTPNVFSDLEGWFLTSPVYILKGIEVKPNVQGERQGKRLSVVGLIQAMLKKHKHSGIADYQPYNYFSYLYSRWKLSSDGQYWELNASLDPVDYKEVETHIDKLLTDELFYNTHVPIYVPKN